MRTETKDHAGYDRTHHALTYASPSCSTSLHELRDTYRMTVNTQHSQRGTPGADSVKVKAAITWVGAADGVSAEVPQRPLLTTACSPTCNPTRAAKTCLKPSTPTA
jgi:hypothetical protein